jgi:hypothetical protein
MYREKSGCEYVDDADTQVDVERFRRMDGGVPTPTHTYVYDTARARAESPQLREIGGKAWVEVGAAMIAAMGAAYLSKRRY